MAEAEAGVELELRTQSPVVVLHRCNGPSSPFSPPQRLFRGSSETLFLILFAAGSAHEILVAANNYINQRFLKRFEFPTVNTPRNEHKNRGKYKKEETRDTLSKTERLVGFSSVDY